MDDRGEHAPLREKRNPAPPKPRSYAIATAGIRTSTDFAALFAAVMADVMDERLTTEKALALCNAGGKLLKCVEMQHKYGRKDGTALELTQGSHGSAP
jgi:hypothetical protein